MANDEEPKKKGPDGPDDTPEFEEEETTAGTRPSFNARLARVVRTESSEVYIMWQDDVRLGQIDFHFGWDLIHATMILEKELTTQEQADLVELIDQDIVSSHLPRFAREDFLVTVFRGVELDPFSDGPEDDDDEDDDDDDDDIEEY